MVLGVMRKLKLKGQALLMAAGLLAGCTNAPDAARQAAIPTQQIDWGTQGQTSVAKAEETITVRAQNPNSTLSANVPAAAAAANGAAQPMPIQGEPQVCIVATIGTTPIYEREVREAVYQAHLRELLEMPAYERTAKEKALFKEELHRLIERELILEELFAMLGQQKAEAMLNQLKEAAAKEANARVKDFQKRAGLQTEDDFKMALQSQGLTVAGVRRSFERSFMMRTYVDERIKPKRNSISLIDVKDYYAAHPEEFLTTERVKWQDVFVSLNRFKTNEDAYKYANWVLESAQYGTDFAKLINECDMGNCKDLGGFGYGEERGKISPPELEDMIFKMKKGQVGMVRFETGYHIVRIAEKTSAGKRPLDEQLQGEIRRKLEAIVGEQEYRKIIDNLWRRAQPQIISE